MAEVDLELEHSIYIVYIHIYMIDKLSREDDKNERIHIIKIEEV